MPATTQQRIARIVAPAAHPLSLGLEIKISPNYLLYAKPHLDSRVIKEHIGYARLPESGDRTPHGKYQAIKFNPKFRDTLEDIVTFQVDETHGLMVILTIQAQTNEVKLRYLNFDTNPIRHSLSKVGKTVVPFQDTLVSYQLQIYGELVGLLLMGRDTSSLYLIGWIKGSAHSHLVHHAPAKSITSFSFLSKDKLLTTNVVTKSIDLWSFYPGAPQLQAMACLGMPSINARAAVENFTCTPLTAEQLSAWQNWDDLFIIFTLTMVIKQGAYAVVSFVIQRDRLDRLSYYTGQMPWSHWGSTGVTCFDESEAKDDCNISGNHFTLVSTPHARGKPCGVVVLEFPGFNHKPRPFYLNVDGVSPFNEHVGLNLDCYVAFTGQIHCDKLLVTNNRRIFAIKSSSNDTTIDVFCYY